ncbi:MAG TPA: cupin domain-containing protein [Acidobacteriota bacterium]|nr:cupin domain-containing protein [Acidobacteriota bacterium]
MLTRRDLLVATVSLCVTLGLVVLARPETAVMHSTVFDWNSIQAEPKLHGATRRFFQAPTATLDELELHVTTLNPGKAPHPPHKHSDEELIIIKEGTVESTLNGEARTAGPGSVIFQASNEMHGLRNVSDKPATYFVIKWISPGMKKQ